MTTPYDAVFYPGHYYEHTHPSHLATLATLYGMTPVPVERCRVLELGCGIGGNLIPMAYQHPDSIFVGIDLSGATIARGQQDVASLGLTNLELLHRDIMDIDESLGQFDYIVAHGVYSWVPPLVREKMMSIFKCNLSAHGVVYVSYNAHPYSHMRNLARDMMLFHTRDIADTAQKVLQSRAILSVLSEASSATTVHGAILRDQYNRVKKMPDAVLFHDDLNAAAAAFLLHEVADTARSHGLQYLSDADFTRRRLDGLDASARAMLEQFPDTEFLARDQIQDFIYGTGFRSTLLCHDSIPLNRTIGKEFASAFQLAGTTCPVMDDYTLADDSPMDFRTEDGGDFSVATPILKAAYVCLGEAWPGAVAFDELIETARTRLGADNVSDLQEDRRVLARAMSVLAEIGVIEFRLATPAFAVNVSDRPTASPVARWQASKGPRVCNLMQRTVRLNDEGAQRFIQLLDGTRSIGDLAGEMSLFPVSSEASDHRDNDSTSAEDKVMTSLRMLSRLALLSA